MATETIINQVRDGDDVKYSTLSHGDVYSHFGDIYMKSSHGVKGDIALSVGELWEVSAPLADEEEKVTKMDVTITIDLIGYSKS